MAKALKPTKPSKGWANALAEHLLTRHLQVSWPLQEDPPHWMSRQAGVGMNDGSWLDNDHPYEGLTRGDLRTIAVVGAGGSRPLPMAETLLVELEQRYIGRADERDAALERLERVYGFDRNSLEARLAAMSLTPESLNTTRSAIAERFHRQQPTLLPYEILAHLLKHRFLAAIINFNFDELLDQSLSDELGDLEFRRIVTERDCVDVQPDPTATNYLPLYIKMHGTASEPETLRFTQEAYYDTPTRITRTVETLLDTDHCVLLNVGYQMANFDFQYLLRRPRKLSLYHMDPFALTSVKTIRGYRRSERPAQGKQGGLKVTRCAPKGWPERCEDEMASEESRFLEETFEPLLEALESAANAGPEGGTQRAHWRSTERHRAVVELLRDSDLDTDDDYVKYLRRRTIIELAFAAAKGRGVVSIEPLIKDRPGRCFDAYCRMARAARKRPQSWSMLCKAGGLVRGENSPPDTYHVAKEVLAQAPGGTPTAEDAWGIHRLQVIDPTEMARHVLRAVDPVRWAGAGLPKTHQEWKPEAQAFRQALDHLCKDTEVELHATDDRICSKVFEQPRVLVTLTAMQGWTHRLLKDRRYTELWVSAESGNWLAQHRHLVRPGTKIKLIAAFAPEGETLTRETLVDPGAETLGLESPADTPPSVDRLLLPWFRHNRHMTILRRGDEPIAAIYFARRLRTPLVTPVVLASQADLGRVELSFRLLWNEAERYMSQTMTVAPPNRRRFDLRTANGAAYAGPERRGGDVERRAATGRRAGDREPHRPPVLPSLPPLPGDDPPYS